MEAFYLDENEIDIEEYSNTQEVEKLFDVMKQMAGDVSNILSYSCKQNENSIRKLKITEISYATTRLYSKFIPFIRLSGRWLEKAGFKAGEFVQVITIKDMVLLVPVKVPENWDETV